MEKVTRSNLKLSMPSRNRSGLKEQALAAWHFQPSNKANHQHTDTAWIFEAAQRDMETRTRALVTELNSTPDDDGLIIRTSDEKNAGPSTSEVTSSSVSSCDPGSPSQAAQEVSSSMIPGNQTPPAKALSIACNNQRSILAMNNFICKRLWQRRKRAPITILRADPTDVQATIQQMTGLPHESSNRTAPCRLRTQPKPPPQIGSNNSPSASLTLDSSSVGPSASINSSFVIGPNYQNAAACCNSLASSSQFHGN